MLVKPIWFSIGLLVSVFAYSGLALSYDALILGVPNFKPYTYSQNDKVMGTAIEPAKTALSAINAPFTIKQYPNYSKLLKALKKNEIQGFFLASKNSERDRYAQFSKPFTTNNWTWFTLEKSNFNVKSDDFKMEGTVATISKTNSFRWLTRSGFQVHGDLTPLLPGLLINKKVDALFAAEAVIELAFKEKGIPATAYKKTVESYKPFAMYISKQYLLNNEGFMDELNNNIEFKP